MPCLACQNHSSTHKTIYLVPREWQKYHQVECIIWKCHSEHYRNNKQTEGIELEAQGMTVRVKNYSDHLWLKKISDLSEKPDRKSYFSVFVPCVYCN